MEWSIQEVSRHAGTTSRTLRHYDDKGVLPPADVAHQSSHRRYDERQVRAGVLTKTLRDAGVPLPAVAAAVANGTAMEELQVHRENVLRAREAEDAAFDSACAVLQALSVPVEVVEREMPAQPYVGRVLALDPDGGDPAVGDEEANAAFGELFERVQHAGLGPAGYAFAILHLITHGFFKAGLFLGAGLGHDAVEVFFDHRDAAADEVAQIIGKVRVDSFYQKFPRNCTVVLKRHFMKYEVTNRIHAE